LRIAYIITRADAVGGATIHVRDLAREMIARGHEARAFVGGAGPVTDQLKAAGVPYTSLRYLQRAIHPVHDLHAYTELRNVLRDYAPDLVSCHTAKAGWLGRAAAHALGLKTIYTPHGWAISDRISRIQGAVYTIAERIAASWADAIVCVSEAEKSLALAKRVAPADKLRVIHNGVRDIPPQLLARPAQEPVRLISVARFEPPKDHITLLKALSEIADLPWELDLIGEGPLEPVVRQHARGLEDRIHYHGYISDTAHALAKSSIFLLSSRSEGFPRSILEAMRAGLPVIASDVGGVRESVADAVTGYVVPPGSPGALAAALRRLMNSASERQRMGEAGRLRFQERFDLKCMIDNTYYVYATIVGVQPVLGTE
jgi:glycosyltransferase involved in cell wall biosynthesis